MPDSYTPYSGSNEICYIKGKSEIIYPGVRIENISYPLTISAMQAAVCSCLANNDKPAGYLLTHSQSALAELWIEEFGMDPLTKNEIIPDSSLFNPLIKTIPDIAEYLSELTHKAVIPNSDFPVSVLIETESGFIEGVNIEPADWSMGLCAERVAISRAISSGITGFKAIHIYAPKSGFVSPCGACRQILAEFMPDAAAELHHGDGTFSRHIISHLLPFGFTSDKLNN